jgi:hypothetical protein
MGGGRESSHVVPTLSQMGTWRNNTCVVIHTAGGRTVGECGTKSVKSACAMENAQQVAATVCPSVQLSPQHSSAIPIESSECPPIKQVIRLSMAPLLANRKSTTMQAVIHVFRCSNWRMVQK